MEQTTPNVNERICRKKPLGALLGAAVMLSVAYFNPTSVSKVVCEFNAEPSQAAQPPKLVSSASQCASLIVSEVSWFEWAVGKSSSYQFHFFDLLELLYGKSDSGLKAPSGQ